MQILKNRKLLSAVSVIIAISMVFLLFSMTGCLGRVARARAIARALAEDAETQQQLQEDISEDDASLSEDEEDESDDNMSSDSGTTESSSTIQDDMQGQDLQQDDSLANDDDTLETGGDEDQDEDFEDQEDDSSEESEQYSANMPYVKAEGGNIWEDEAFNDSSLIIGDTGGDNIQSRAYISFDISELAGAQILDALLNANASDIRGKPFDTYGPVIVKAVYWGANPINSSMFNMDGVELANFSSKNFGIGNQKLKNDLQNAASSGSGRYQIMLYFEMDETDGDGETDYVLYDTGANAITLNVTYTK